MPQITIKSVIILTVYLKKILQELVGSCSAKAYYLSVPCRLCTCVSMDEEIFDICLKVLISRFDTALGATTWYARMHQMRISTKWCPEQKAMMIMTMMVGVPCNKPP